MLLPVEQALGGVWLGALPEEFDDFDLAREMGWTWEQLQAQPLYVRRTWLMFIRMRREAEREAAEKARERAGMVRGR